ncbi:MEDS domain-containing protein [Kibdelosporangium banguiense]|uniref:MEDS domain-containing protein n=1 Tax=Kibdelosporangium banguiense TaxID=1365924 RepID=UPI001AE77011|nr:MEDS domain-containing protein [Kibdelosporangium banguiense]
MESDDEYQRLARPLLDEGARFGDKLIVFGLAPAEFTGYVVRHDVPLGTEVLTWLRTEAETAGGQGYRGVRVVADMQQLGLQPDASGLLAFELALDRTVTELGVTMLCAYRSGSFDRDTVAVAMSAHPCGYGLNSEDVGFRMWSGDDDCWNVSGALDLVNAGTFRTALTKAAHDSTRLRLTFVELRFVDLAGVQALADVTENTPGLSMTVTTPSNSFRRCWRMLGYDETCPRVEIVS